MSKLGFVCFDAPFFSYIWRTSKFSCVLKVAIDGSLCSASIAVSSAKVAVETFSIVGISAVNHNYKVRQSNNVTMVLHITQ